MRGGHDDQGFEIGGRMNKPEKSIHEHLKLAHKHTESAAEIIHGLLSGPDKLDQIHLEAAMVLLRKALMLMDGHKF